MGLGLGMDGYELECINSYYVHRSGFDDATMIAAWLA